MIYVASRYVGRGLAAACALAAAQLLPFGAQAADYNVGPMHIDYPWTRATPKGASSGAGYLTVTNNGTTPDRLSCTSSDAAGGCQIHSMTMDNGVMKMRPLANGIEIKPGQTVELNPSGYHMMLVGLKQQLMQGDHFKATLEFEKAGKVDVEFIVESIGAQTGGDHAMPEMHMKH